MKIVCISDTHNKHRELKLPEGDIIVHAGDISMGGRIEEVKSFLHWFDRTPYRAKFFIAGNHDWLFQKNPTLARSLVDETDSVVYIQDELVEFEGLKIWGSPFQPWFFDWSFNFNRDPIRGRKEAEELWSKIPLVDVLITHGPMKGVGDKTIQGIHAGCPVLYEKVMKVVRPKLHICGHIHEQKNIYRLDNDNIISVNACSLNEKYQYIKDGPIVIELVDGKVKI